MEHSPAPSSGKGRKALAHKPKESPDAAAQPGRVRQGCAMLWRPVDAAGSARMAQARCAQGLQGGEAPFKAGSVPTGTLPQGFSVRLLFRHEESPLHQGRVSARLTGLHHPAMNTGGGATIRRENESARFQAALKPRPRTRKTVVKRAVNDFLIYRTRFYASNLAVRNDLQTGLKTGSERY